MARGERYHSYIESISRSEDDRYDNVKAKNEPNDAQFLGFKGLREYVYRVCRPDEIISTGIVCKDSSSTRTIEEHVASGSKYGSKYISTTAGFDVALHYAFYEMDTKDRKKRQSQLRVVRIDLNVLKGTDVEKGCANLTDENVRKHFIKGAIHRNWVISSQEVIFTVKIPKHMNGKLVYEVLEDLECPPQPPPREEKKKKTDDLPEDLLTGMQKMGPNPKKKITKTKK